MFDIRSARTLVKVAAATLALCSAAAQAGPPAQTLPNETPEKFEKKTDSFDFVKREEMIPMRDGVKLKTFILIPKGARQAPILLTRTPYNAGERVARTQSPRLISVVPQMDDTAVQAGYIIAFQDVRGKYGSEGDYVMTRPLRGPLNPTPVDHATDTYDTIDWLVKNIPECNGRVGLLGGSYEGFTAVMGTVNPHPALKASVPFAPMVDGWVGDDWFHHGAFRQDGSLAYVYEQEATRKNEEEWWSGTRDTYDEYLRAGSAGAMAASRGLDQTGFWRLLVQHTAYDSFWQDQALDKIMAKEPIKVPTMIVSGLFDQEDIYGGPALFKALAPKDTSGMVHLVLGPWSHGQSRREGRALGQMVFEGDTATWFRRAIMQPFLDHYLKDGPKPNTPRALVYETGADEWHRYDAWPRVCEQGCAARPRNLYLLADGRLGFDKPAAALKAKYAEYVSDPAKPVPYRLRPTLASSAADSTWGEWLVDDQRNAAARPDVLVYETEPLKEPLRLAGEPVATLFASTTGTDADWVVKIIDVLPDEDADHPKLGGYQWMISADILRGRYRQDPANPKPIDANKVLPYRLPLPNVSHTFQRGHRIMVQIQSTWFPLYDRNPQKFVPNIMLAKKEDYVKATHRVWSSPDAASFIEFPVYEETRSSGTSE